MASITSMQRALIRGLQGDGMPQGCTKIEITPVPMAAKERCISVFFRTDAALTEKMFALPAHQYPLEFLQNHNLVYGHVADYFKSGQLNAVVSELFTGALAGIPAGEQDPAGGYWGTQVDTRKGIWRVPPVNISALKFSAPQPPACDWRTALMASDWRRLPEIPNDSAPELQLVHIPGKPLNEITVEEWRKITIYAIGHNIAAFKPASQMRLVGNVMFRLLTAETVDSV